MNIAIYCGSSFGNDPLYEQKAKEIITFLHTKNASLVYGGSKSGIMGTISQQALALDMTIHGVITQNLANKEIVNRNISDLYFVDNIRQRKEKMEQLADAFIAFPGGYGTLEEISEVFTSIQIGTHAKPCALYNLNGYYDKLVEFIDSCVHKGFIKEIHKDAIIVSDDIEVIYNAFVNYKAPPNKWQI